MKNILRYVAVALVFVFITVLPAHEVSAFDKLFRSIDENADGKIEKEEFSEDMKQSTFDKLDGDNDRSISDIEWADIDVVSDREKQRALFKKIDKDSDRRITFLEFSDYADEHSNIERAFMTLDKDKDGALSPDEISVRPLLRMITIKF